MASRRLIQFERLARGMPLSPSGASTALSHRRFEGNQPVIGNATPKT